MMTAIKKPTLFTTAPTSAPVPRDVAGDRFVAVNRFKETNAAPMTMLQQRGQPINGMRLATTNATTAIKPTLQKEDIARSIIGRVFSSRQRDNRSYPAVL
jgi:hypothetical protein